MNPTKWYEEAPGVVSSKRLCGGACLLAGGLMKLAVFVWALVNPLGDAATAVSVSDGFITAGVILLGITGLDVFKR